MLPSLSLNQAASPMSRSAAGMFAVTRAGGPHIVRSSSVARTVGVVDDLSRRARAALHPGRLRMPGAWPG